MANPQTSTAAVIRSFMKFMGRTPSYTIKEGNLASSDSIRSDVDHMLLTSRTVAVPPPLPGILALLVRWSPVEALSLVEL
jgi:hypothetical protein